MKKFNFSDVLTVIGEEILRFASAAVVLALLFASGVTVVHLVQRVDNALNATATFVADAVTDRIGNAYWGKPVAYWSPVRPSGELLLGYEKRPGIRDAISNEKVVEFFDDHIAKPEVNDIDVAKAAASFSRSTGIPVEYIGYVGPEDCYPLT